MTQLQPQPPLHCWSLNKGLSLDLFHVSNFSILIWTQIQLLPLKFLPVLISKVDFRYFEILDVSKTNQTNFRLTVTNKSPKPWSWQHLQKSTLAGKMIYIYNLDDPTEDTVQLFCTLCSYVFGLIYLSFTLIWKLVIPPFSDSDCSTTRHFWTVVTFSLAPF